VFPILDKIDSPTDLRALDIQDLPRLAEEIRSFIVQSVSQTGGHLAPSLGTVELTLALHYVYQTPKDKLVWDTGHQAYGHKVITGRRDRFHTLRQFGGICGFPKRTESEYDTFAVGHAGTALSAAYGMARARDIKGDDFHVVAVVGDASISNGLSMEAINNIGHAKDGKKTNMVVVLNDNEMSISPNVGAMAAHLNKILTGKAYQQARSRVESWIERIPKVGRDVLRMTHHAEEALKGFMTPGTLFEELGFTYYGPIDGHDVATMVEIFRRVREIKGPILLHVITRKGKGYAPAEGNPEKFHGVAVFDPDTGLSSPAPPNGPPSYTQVFSDTMLELAEKRKDMVAITAAMPDGTGLKAFGERYPDRYFDVGIAEGHAGCMAAGLACEGLKPVVAVYSTFVQRAYDNIIHDVCMQKLPVVFALDRGGIVGEDGETHTGAFDLSFLRCVPHLVLMAPSDENEMRQMLYTAVEYEGPSALRYPRGAGEGVSMDKGFKRLEIGKGEILREGTDVALLAIGRMVGVAKRAADLLSAKGISVSVANMRFVKPLDEALVLHLAGTTKALVTLEENAIQGGFGSAVAEFLAQKTEATIPLKIIGFPDEFIEHGKPQVLREKWGLDAEGVTATISVFLKAITQSRRIP
jgi:1-deoxy-D-xylulose-5-phosphate synthase